jgi:Undecaprenyl-phosphate galactose phosphotransferase WbaP
MSTVMNTPELQGVFFNRSTARFRSSVGRRARQTWCVLMLVVMDILGIACSLQLAILLRIYWLPQLERQFSMWSFPFRYYLEFGWLWLLVVVFLGVEGLYTQRRSLWNEIGHIIKAVALGIAAILAAVALTHQVVSRATVILTGVNLLILLPVIRRLTKQVLGMVGLWRKRILILGNDSSAKLAMEGLTTDPVLGYEVVGMLDDDPASRGTRAGVCAGQSVFVLGSLSEAREIMEQTRARDVLISLPGLAEAKLMTLVHQLQRCCESIYLIPNFSGLPMMNLQVDGLLRERVMMLKLSNNLAKPWNNWVKRSSDLLFGTIAMLLALPMCVLITILIKMDSTGPALFIQERLGHRGVNFRCLKFRTMHVNGDQKLANYLSANPSAAEEWQKFAKLRAHDPRLTSLGRFLRRWSLDEFPQLVNVLRGDMSLVGPRPYLPHEQGRLGPELDAILSTRPGMTGFWQVHGRNQLTLDNRVQVEAWYVRNWTLWLDCIVLVKTFKAVIFQEKITNPDPDPITEDKLPQKLDSSKETLARQPLPVVSTMDWEAAHQSGENRF